jgi:hypothetical protein
MKNAILVAATVVLVAAAGAWSVEDGAAPAGPATPAAKDIPAAQTVSDKHIDLVICLDTSNSMDGLVESAKQKLWAVVNELATAKPRPNLRVGLYHYGNDGLSPETGWVKQLSPLSDDLDSIYAKLFELRTHGGTEFVARVVRSAVEDLDWNMAKDTLRVIYVAGNEPATQDKKFALQDICKAAASKGIIVNTIFCGGAEEGRRTGWQDAATWADGQYASIDQNSGTVVVASQYDKKLAELGAKLNTTYVAYGKAGALGAANQTAQDTNAGTLNAPAAAERAVAKSTALYRNATWDLVDAAKENKVEIEKVPEKDLPENMQKMTVEQRKQYVAEQAKQREAIQAEIKEISAKRDAELKQKMAEQGLDESKSMDKAVRASIRSQAEKKDFKFEQK